MADKKQIKWESKIKKMLSEVKESSLVLQQISSGKKKRILFDTAKALEKNTRRILKENQKDLKQAARDGLSSAMIDRLTLTPERIKAMAGGVRVVAGLKDMIGTTTHKWKRPNGLIISRVVVPIGVILIIFESRPNVSVECASLCLKSGNAVILRGGREAFYSNRVLISIFKRVLSKHRLPQASVSFVETTDRRAVNFLLSRDQEINLVIPRGGEALIRKVADMSRIPVIKHYKGICHVYVDERADLKKAMAIAFNAKMQRPGVCNAMETLLVHKKVAPKFLPVIGRRLMLAGCEVRGDEQTRKCFPLAAKAVPGDYGYEFLEKILAVKVVPDLKAAIRHIQSYGSGHTDAIVTENKKAAQVFKQSVDSSSVMVNASTRFADGFEYGFGAEIGISTDKIHARGPMGLEGLTTYKYVVEGNGQVRL